MRRPFLSSFIITSMITLIIASSVYAQAVDPQQQRIRFEINRKTRPYTRLLPSIDKVELSKVGQLTADGQIAGIAASKTIEGRETRTIASLWRSQSWDYKYSGMCHMPAYVVKFYSREKLILQASVCWDCGNIQFRESAITGTQGFAPQTKAAKSLLTVFNEAFSRRVD